MVNVHKLVCYEQNNVTIYTHGQQACQRGMLAPTRRPWRNTGSCTSLGRTDLTVRLVYRFM